MALEIWILVLASGRHLSIFCIDHTTNKCFGGCAHQFRATPKSLIACRRVIAPLPSDADRAAIAVVKAEALDTSPTSEHLDARQFRATANAGFARAGFAKTNPLFSLDVSICDIHVLFGGKPPSGKPSPDGRPNAMRASEHLGARDNWLCPCDGRGARQGREEEEPRDPHRAAVRARTDLHAYHRSHTAGPHRQLLELMASIGQRVQLAKHA